MRPTASGSDNSLNVLTELAFAIQLHGRLIDPGYALAVWHVNPSWNRALREYAGTSDYRARLSWRTHTIFTARHGQSSLF